jgi:phosphoribosylaminoimidazole (AIR) synthetase
MSLNKDAGVDYALMGGFKEQMCQVSAQSARFAERRGVFVIRTANAHAGCWVYRGGKPHYMLETIEGLGNKAIIAMMLDQLGLKDPTGEYFFAGLGIDTLLVGVNDMLSHGALPVIITDEVCSGTSDFFASPQAGALARSFLRGLKMMGCAMVQGEAPTYVYLLNPKPGMPHAPSMSIHVTGIVAPRSRFISGVDVRPGDGLIGFPSSGLHANGISPVVRLALSLKEGFGAAVNGWTLGQECLIATRSYVGLMEALHKARITIHACTPITGNGPRKLGVDERFHFNITNWPSDDQLPPLFPYLMSQGVSRQDMAETFNCGIGLVLTAPPKETDKIMKIGQRTKIDGEKGSYNPMVIGKVVAGKPGTTFKPWGLELAPPHE